MTDSSPKSEIILHGLWTRYSSWTSRVELVLEYFKIPYTAEYHNIFDPAFRPIHERLSGRLYSMLQPDSEDPDFVIDESLAICEYLAETSPERGLWPRDAKLRALARGAAAQIHAGFNEIRNTYPTNFIAKYTGKIPINDAAAKEIAKMNRLWTTARIQTMERLRELGEEDEGFLFGGFSIADAFFWPVLWRFRSYQLPLHNISVIQTQWVSKMWNHPVMQARAADYFKQAMDPKTQVDKYEDVFRGNPDAEFGSFEEDWIFSLDDRV
ncbi:glutathione s-transferase [Seiridium cupressi]